MRRKAAPRDCFCFRALVFRRWFDEPREKEYLLQPIMRMLLMNVGDDSPLVYLYGFMQWLCHLANATAAGAAAAAAA